MISYKEDTKVREKIHCSVEKNINIKMNAYYTPKECTQKNYWWNTGGA